MCVRVREGSLGTRLWLVDGRSKGCSHERRATHCQDRDQDRALRRGGRQGIPELHSTVAFVSTA